ncbi:MAG: TrkA family potassium uptake protein [Clostridia bacterium]|nr:TrkA family potassium uptake protein [Clostridia bacterium]
MKSFLLIGVGRFGKHLAKKLIDLGNDVVAVDKEAEKLERLNNLLTDSFVGDCTNEGVLRALGINNYDVCFVCIDDDFQASMEITSMLKELGAQYVVSTAKLDRQSDLLYKIGADDVIYAEKQIAEKTGIRYNAQNIFDLIQVTNEYAIYEIAVPVSWINKSIVEINVRKNHSVNIIAVKNGNEINPAPGANYVFKTNDHIMTIGKQKDIMKLTNQK